MLVRTRSLDFAGVYPVCSGGNRYNCTLPKCMRCREIRDTPEESLDAAPPFIEGDLAVASALGIIDLSTEESEADSGAAVAEELSQFFVLMQCNCMDADDNRTEADDGMGAFSAHGVVLDLHADTNNDLLPGENAGAQRWTLLGWYIEELCARRCR